MNRINRCLSVESLETRKMLACDAVAAIQGELDFNLADTNRDGLVSPLDALTVINKVNAGEFDSDTCEKTDVNVDGQVTPLDALVVINELNSPQDKTVTAFPAASGRVSIEPDRDAIDRDTLITNTITGMAEERATEVVEFFNYEIRVYHRDGEDFLGTTDVQLNRMNFKIIDGRVDHAFVG